MRARVELSDSERKILVTLDDEELEVLVEQMLATVREELEWEVVVERAHQSAASATTTVNLAAAAAAKTTLTSSARGPLPTRTLPSLPRSSSASPPSRSKFSWPSTPRRAAR
jgi:hypothetical protein